jgi:hypothetical protein
VTSREHPYAEFQRALKNGNVWVAEAVARELPKVSLEDALKLVHLYAKKESPKFEKAAMKWLRRYLNEASPELSEVAWLSSTSGATHRMGKQADWASLHGFRAVARTWPISPRTAPLSYAVGLPQT